MHHKYLRLQSPATDLHREANWALLIGSAAALTTRPSLRQSNKYERYDGPGIRLLPYLLLYMPSVRPACRLCINIHYYAPPHIRGGARTWA